MEISADFCGGNIRVIDIREEEIIIERDMRDSSGTWFYWAFCVRGAQGRKIRFRFASSPRVGRFGPAVSHDLKTWEWLGKAESDSFDSFSYTFAPYEQEVWFAHNMLYLPEYFFDFAAENGLEVHTLCKTELGRELPYVSFGGGSKNIILTARHHCCESTGSYVLEGVIKRFLEKKPDFNVIAVPFVDYDGVCCGDQGKNRIPHDHNRDYDGEPLYASVRAIKELTSDKDIRFAFDFHSPSHMGGRNDTPFIVRKSSSEALAEFSNIFEACILDGAFVYKAENDILPGVEWNKISAVPQTFAQYFMSRGAELAFTLETPYFGRECDKVSADKLRLLGKSFADAVIKFDEKALIKK